MPSGGTAEAPSEKRRRAPTGKAGTGKLGRREYEGLDEPPVTPAGTPGLRFELVSERGGSVSTGDPIVYKGFRIGRIESASGAHHRLHVPHRALYPGIMPAPAGQEDGLGA